MTLPGFPDALPLHGLVGGVLIGLGAAVMLLGLGRIAGVSGITARLALPAPWSAQRATAAMFVIGIVLGTLLYDRGVAPVETTFPPSMLVLLLAGLLVGLGTRIGSGCTSGHGVCGLSRGSRRSFVAVLTFMATAIATVAVMRFAGLS